MNLVQNKLPGECYCKRNASLDLGFGNADMGLKKERDLLEKNTGKFLSPRSQRTLR
jgi:hypothetical protein